MHLVEILALRPVPAAGIFLSLTRRCPLSCAHCSTNSHMDSEELDDHDIMRFVNTFTPKNRPSLILLTGGEPLLRPDLVNRICDKANAIGSKVSLISGMFFVRQKKIPIAIIETIKRLDHFTVSLDVFHEKQVSRHDIIIAVKRIRELGVEVSFQVVGLDEFDPYLSDVADNLEKEFNGEVPALFTSVAPNGRAREWLKSKSRDHFDHKQPEPCSMVAWPVVTFKGDVAACCNQDVVDGPTPDHLLLGNIKVSTWSEIKKLYLESRILRALRIFGPVYLANRLDSNERTCDGYCDSCRGLTDDQALSLSLKSIFERPTIGIVEDHVITAISEQMPMLGMPKYKDMAFKGWKPLQL